MATTPPLRVTLVISAPATTAPGALLVQVARLHVDVTVGPTSATDRAEVVDGDTARQDVEAHLGLLAHQLRNG